MQKPNRALDFSIVDPALNPYSPGSGRRPPELVGRDAELGAFDTVVARTGNKLTDRGIVLTGLRGVGKTVLLNAMRDHANRHEWFTVKIEARADDAGAASVRRTLARELAAGARRFNREGIGSKMRQALQTIQSFNAKVGVTGIELGVQLESGRADSGDPEIDFAELVEDITTGLPSGRAFAIFIDEMQDLDNATMSALVATQHAANQNEWPFFIVAAGLPNLPRALAEARSYSERIFSYRTIGQLSPSDAAQALREPAQRLGANYAQDALDELVDVAGGYPYFLQEYGKAVWDLAPEKTIRLSDATAAINYGRTLLDDGFFRSRWDRATKAERRFLVAMAHEGDAPSSTGDVAQLMGLKRQSLGPYRAGLISKGLVYAPEHGYVAYTVPGMADYVARRQEDLD